jgi:predicted permease
MIYTLIIGYLFKTFKLDYSKELIDIVIYISFPALVISKVSKISYDSKMFTVIFLAIIAMSIGAIVSFLLAKLFKFDIKTTASFVLVSTLGNTSFIGFPFVSEYFGNDNLIWAIFYDQLGSFLALIIFGSIVVAYGSGSKVDTKEIIKKIFRFPPFIALWIGIIFNIFDVEIKFLEFIGNSLLFLVLLAVGMKFSFLDLKKNLNLSFLALFIKMLLTPFLIYLIIINFYEVSLPFKIAMIESAMPPMVMASVLAIEYRLREDLAVSAVGLGMIISFITIPIFVNLV